MGCRAAVSRLVRAQPRRGEAASAHSVGTRGPATRTDPRVAHAVSLAALAIVFATHAAAADAAEAAARKRAGVDAVWVTQRASEAGAWWALVQTACDGAAAAKLLDEMNDAMVAIGRHELQPLVAERIEDPFLDDRSRDAMERTLQQAVAARRQAEEMQQAKAALGTRKGAAAPVASKQWQVARPIRSGADLDAALRDTERALAAFCAQGTSKAKAVLFDPDDGLVARLR